ncbi:hypothetical protein BOTBODRAFT_31254 [Botryobasidium botryosum FD-172 SS1]|uniref:HNH nuclease domain-containing protein n=1 Tax=Botryobasidium botryosum (strain FD-172 SS1) TaxID=930990 RepID=A0A067MWB4_BOTB1|nr:hypothetical protein BOTBODRAFT_31254 [Botryobasidium botryosum FD-172 SS1]
MSDQTGILAAENKIQNYVPRNAEDLTVPMLSAILEHAPQRAHVAEEIYCCETDEKLADLANRYQYGLIVPMRANGAKTPEVGSHPSLSSAVENELRNEDMLELTKRRQHKQALLRDGNRCLVTKLLDMGTPSHGEERINTFAAHIIPFSFLPSSTSEAQIERSSHLFEVLDRFGGVQLNDENGEKINLLDNVMTLKMELHTLFGQLAIWFEPVLGEENTYQFRKLSDVHTGVADRTKVVFSTDHPDIPLPNPRYLAVHAACAKVVHASGVAEVIDKVLRDLEDLPVLSKDGSSSDLLRAALAAVAVY